MLAAVQGQRLDLAPATLNWAQIAAQCGNLATAADFVNATVRKATEAGDTGHALEYLKAATLLAGSLGEQLELAVTQAQRDGYGGLRKTGCIPLGKEKVQLAIAIHIHDGHGPGRRGR